jgi:dephospho-CoA kinase
MHLGLTGGMGCGKSSVLNFFSENGWHCVESDAVVRSLLENDSEVISAVRDRFGPNVVEGGKVNRASLGAAVFNDAAALRWLEELLHPRVRAQWQASIAAHPRAVVEIPLLYEKNLENQFDLNVCVTAGLSTQLERLAKRGFSREQALARMARQLPLAEKEKRADVVISNNGTLDFTRMQVVHLLALLQP